MNEQTRPEIPKEIYAQTLKSMGIDVPRNPDPNSSSPRRWLLRGEPSIDRLTKNLEFIPQSGEWGRHGVFFGDSINSTSFPNSGVIYITERDKISPHGFLNNRSPKYYQELRRVAKERSLNLGSISGGIEAESVLSQQNNVYDPKSGVVTIAHPLTIDDVDLILVARDQYQLMDSKTLKKYKDKLVIID